MHFQNDEGSFSIRFVSINISAIIVVTFAKWWRTFSCDLCDEFCTRASIHARHTLYTKNQPPHPSPSLGIHDDEAVARACAHFIWQYTAASFQANCINKSKIIPDRAALLDAEKEFSLHLVSSREISSLVFHSPAAVSDVMGGRAATSSPAENYRAIRIKVVTRFLTLNRNHVER